MPPVSFGPGFFPSVIIEAAQNAERLTGCPASVALAQWALESGYGKYDLGANNPFGIKARPGDEYVISRTKEWVRSETHANGGFYFAVEAHFRKFATIQGAFVAHGQLAERLGGSPKDIPAFVRKMSQEYATDPHYADKVLDIIQRFTLVRYDKLTEAPETANLKATT